MTNTLIILTIALLDTNTVLLTHTITAGKYYRVERAPIGETNRFLSVIDWPNETTGSSNHVVKLNWGTPGNYMYRVRILE